MLAFSGLWDAKAPADLDSGLEMSPCFHWGNTRNSNMAVKPIGNEEGGFVV